MGKYENDIYKYEVILYWSSDDQAFLAEVPELPGCMAHGESQELALANVHDAAQERLDILLARNNADELTDVESFALDQLLEQIDHLNILKTRARYTLHEFVAQA